MKTETILIVAAAALGVYLFTRYKAKAATTAQVYTGTYWNPLNGTAANSSPDIYTPNWTN